MMPSGLDDRAFEHRESVGCKSYGCREVGAVNTPKIGDRVRVTKQLVVEGEVLRTIPGGIDVHRGPLLGTERFWLRDVESVEILVPAVPAWATHIGAILVSGGRAYVCRQPGGPATAYWVPVDGFSSFARVFADLVEPVLLYDPEDHK